ncbi:MAG: hypothetical protein K1X67_22165 [Fimbriimonadaceae bacterium]|nr:hypothetical protein [Fimbriimonadaceae bacterium]
MALSFRHSAGFGRRMEYWVIGRMLKEGLDVYVPLVDDFGIDAVVRRPSGEFLECQIKARSKTVGFGDAALFAAIRHEIRNNYVFIFYSERMDTTWIMTSEEFLSNSFVNKTGKNAGNRSVWLNGIKKDKVTGERVEYVRPQFEKFVAPDFSRLSSIKSQISEPEPEEAIPSVVPATSSNS